MYNFCSLCESRARQFATLGRNCVAVEKGYPHESGSVSRDSSMGQLERDFTLTARFEAWLEGGVGRRSSRP